MAASLARLNSAASTHYYAKENYYSHEKGIENSSWFGKGAGYFNLAGKVEPEKFKNLMEGKDPSGERYLAGVKPRTRINQKSGEIEKHRAAVDVVFAPPKSVSLAALVEGQTNIENAHCHAVEKTLVEVEKKFSTCRIGSRKERFNRVCGNLIVARFEHDTSRSKDPQLHTHCVVISATRKPDQEWRRLNNDVFWDNSKYINDYYLDALKEELKKINVPLIEKNDSHTFEIEGYDVQLLKQFSKQTDKIKNLVSQDKFKENLNYQMESGRDKDKSEKYVERKLKLLERARKGEELSRDELQSTWKNEKENVFNLPSTEGHFLGDFVALGAGYLMKQTLNGFEHKFNLTCFPSTISALTQIELASQIQGSSLTQESYGYGGSVVGGYLGTAMGELIGGPGGAFFGHIFGSEIGHNIGKDVYDYFFTSDQKEGIQELDNSIKNENLKEAQFEVLDKDQYLEGSMKNIDPHNDFFKWGDDMRELNKQKFSEVESEKDYDNGMKFEFQDHHLEKEQNSLQKDLENENSHEKNKIEVSPEKTQSQEQERNVQGASQEQDKKQNSQREIDFDNWEVER